MPSNKSFRPTRKNGIVLSAFPGVGGIGETLKFGAGFCSPEFGLDSRTV